MILCLKLSTITIKIILNYFTYSLIYIVEKSIKLIIINLKKIWL